MKKLFVSLIAFAAAALRGVGERAHDALFGYMVRSGAVLAMDTMPSAADFNARRVTNPAQSEVIRQRFYDYQLYATAGAQQLTFFQAPVGQGITTALGGVVGTPKSLWDTNLELGGTLPSGKGFMIESIEVIFWAGSSSAANTFTPAAISAFRVAAAAQTAVNDVNSFYLSGMLELNVLSKNYLRETPLVAFPPKANLEVSAAVESTSATVGESVIALAKAGGRPYFVSPEIALQPAVNFEVTLKWPAAVVTPSGFNARVGVILDGYFMRASQ